jgi:hypothetical protein
MWATPLFLCEQDPVAELTFAYFAVIQPESHESCDSGRLFYKTGRVPKRTRNSAQTPQASKLPVILSSAEDLAGASVGGSLDLNQIEKNSL